MLKRSPGVSAAQLDSQLTGGGEGLQVRLDTAAVCKKLPTAMLTHVDLRRLTSARSRSPARTSSPLAPPRETARAGGRAGVKL